MLDFEISGKKRSAEDLGFNTDISKAQEKTKDEEKTFRCRTSY